MKKKAPKTLLIGAGGFLGNNLHKAHRLYFDDCIGTYYTKGEPILDLLNPNLSALNLFNSGYKEVIIAAGVINVYKCEYEKKATYPANVTGTLELIRQINQEGLKPVFISTDWVFKGDIGNYDDYAKPGPVCGYGAQKAEVEEAIPGICEDNYLIVRLGKLFSLTKGDNSFLDQIARTLSQNKIVKAAKDQIFNPLFIDDAVRAILGLQCVGAKGTVNISSPEIYSRLEMAYDIADEMGKDRCRIESISLDQIDEIERPKRTNMTCNRLAKLAPLDFTPTSKCIKKIASNYMEP